ncbi:AMP-binding protein [Novosphingobium sp.]|uniref:AMP-binding protein n=1 Tax=Novosphingobium sp. TaxID=1874826 RepID=UPI002629E121|nr:AMP-binding protein [Novosphingobium sp.]
MAKQFHLADLFETVAATVPAKIALESDSLTLTFAELNARADKIASGLSAHGVKRGDTVGLYMMNRAEYIEAFIAIVKLGAVPFNVNFRYREDELRYLFQNASAAAIIHGAEFSGIVRALQPHLPGLKVAVAVDDGSGADTGGLVAYGSLLDCAAVSHFPRDEDDILLIYTGGTTGMPKGVMWRHKDFVFGCIGGAGYFTPSGAMQVPQDIAERAANGYPLKLFPLAPLMHAAALWAAMSALFNGLTVVVDENRTFDAQAIWTKIEALGVNIVQIVGDAMAIPLRDALRANPDRWNLQRVVNFGSGGAVFSQSVKDDLRQLLPATTAITDGMGSSETGIAGPGAVSRDGMMQLPSGDNLKVVVDDRFAVAGETGIIARSGHMPVGYFGDPVKTAEVFRTIEGKVWVISGDAGRLEADGMITVFGRGSTCINSGGEKVFPEEVEQVLRDHPAILDAVVAGQPDPRWGERVVAIVSPRDDAVRPPLAELREFLGQRLAGYKVPKALVWVDAVRRSPAGKQDYRWALSIAANALD